MDVISYTKAQSAHKRLDQAIEAGQNLNGWVERTDQLDQKIVQKNDEVKADVYEQYVRVKKGKNLYNAAINQQGILLNNGVGNPQTIDTSSALVWQKIKIDNNNDYTLSGIRVYSVTDKDDKAVITATYIAVNAPFTLLKGSIPVNAHYLWVSTYTANATTDSQVEVGQQKTVYEPYKPFDGVESNGQVLPVLTESEINDTLTANEKTWSSAKINSEFSTDFYELSAANSKIAELTDRLNVANRNLSSLYNAKKSGASTSQTVPVKNTGKQKMILHLHKRANAGYDTANDVYLPDAENDFSDVRIKTVGGKILPHHVVYKGNIDIIADKRLGMNHLGKVFTDSLKNMINSVGGYVKRSSDNGVTWETLQGLQAITNPYVVNVINDVIFFSKNGILYRSVPPYSAYTQVLDTTVGYTGCFILSTSMTKHPDGELFLGSYQTERVIRIYKSTDNGLTWESIYNVPDTYQHVHHMYVDVHSNPVAIYAGVDGGGGVLKSTDKGATWVDLRALYPNMPQSTDYGVIFSSEDGAYRLLGGETAIVGGYSILKTTDDVNFRPVLGVGNSIYMIKRLNGKLFAGGISTYSFKNAAIYVSEDEGETWTQVYTTQPLQSTGASDGFRYMAKDVYASTDYEQLIVGCQSQVASPLRIISDENTYYAEVIVEMPDDCAEIVVESGYICSSETLISNDFETANNKRISLSLNEGGQYIKESVSGKLFKGDFRYHNVGKHLSYNYPYILDSKDKLSMQLSSLGNGVNVDASLSGLSAFTISFWGRFGYTTSFDLISRPVSTGNDFLRFYRYALLGNSQIVVLRYPIVPNAFSKYDIIVDVTQGKITTYENAKRQAVSSVNISTLLANITGLTTIKLLKAITSDENDAIQHFSIYVGALSESDIYNSYNDFISDNQH
jgi:hypothetical protein